VVVVAYHAAANVSGCPSVIGCHRLFGGAYDTPDRPKARFFSPGVIGVIRCGRIIPVELRLTKVT